MTRSQKLTVALFCVMVNAGQNGRAQQQDDASPRNTAPLTILQLNDVYSTGPINGSGGLARVATLKQTLAATGHAPFMMLAGDFLSSSVESTIFKGEQMVAALNAVGLDLATLGNHEFDFGIDILLQRMREATWPWVVSNVIDLETGKPIGDAQPYLVRTFGPLKVGFIGLCLTTGALTADRLQRIQFIDPITAAETYLPFLKHAQVDVVVALTHLTFAEDRSLAERFPEIDLIVGGHEHFPITATEGRTLISKAGSDAKFVARLDINRRQSGAVERYFELIPITSALAEDPATAAVIDAYRAKLGPELDAVVATSPVPLDAVALHVREAESPLGDLIADAMRAQTGADIALLNSGSIRGDRIIPAGPLSRRTLLEIHPFGNVVCKIAVPGRVVVAALESGVSQLPAAAGQFPQVSGLTLRVDPSAPAGQRVEEVHVNGEPIDLDQIYTMAVPDFLLLGGDGYRMFAGATVLVGPNVGTLLITAMESYLAAGKGLGTREAKRLAISRSR